LLCFVILHKEGYGILFSFFIAAVAFISTIIISHNEGKTHIVQRRNGAGHSPRRKNTNKAYNKVTTHP
jgi:hypothetical protein